MSSTYLELANDRDKCTSVIQVAFNCVPKDCTHLLYHDKYFEVPKEGAHAEGVQWPLVIELQAKQPGNIIYDAKSLAPSTDVKVGTVPKKLWPEAEVSGAGAGNPGPAGEEGVATCDGAPAGGTVPASKPAGSTSFIHV